MSKHRVYSVSISKYKPVDGVRVRPFQYTREFFPQGETQAAIIWKAYVMYGGFRDGFCNSRGTNSFIKEAADVSRNDVLGKLIVFEKFSQEKDFFVGQHPVRREMVASIQECLKSITTGELGRHLPHGRAPGPAVNPPVPGNLWE